MRLPQIGEIWVHDSRPSTWLIVKDGIKRLDDEAEEHRTQKGQTIFYNHTWIVDNGHWSILTKEDLFDELYERMVDTSKDVK